MIELTIRFENREDGRMSIKFFPHKVEGDFIKEIYYYKKICKIIGDCYHGFEKGSDERSYHSFDSHTYTFKENSNEENK